jgi:hypothetical protein
LRLGGLNRSYGLRSVLWLICGRGIWEVGGGWGWEFCFVSDGDKRGDIGIYWWVCVGVVNGWLGVGYFSWLWWGLMGLVINVIMVGIFIFN